ncbi:MAG: SlyX [Verrucomicrobiota bacterium]
MHEELEKRLIKLEGLAAMQDHQLEQLNQLVYSQQQALDLLEKKFRQLQHQSLSSLETGNQKPPHY